MPRRKPKTLGFGAGFRPRFKRAVGDAEASSYRAYLFNSAARRVVLGGVEYALLPQGLTLRPYSLLSKDGQSFDGRRDDRDPRVIVVTKRFSLTDEVARFDEETGEQIHAAEVQ
jgi:hypothetical protein